MTRPRRLLVLRAAGAPAQEPEAIAGAVRAEGVEVVVRDLAGDYEALLDEIAAADTIVCWT